MPADRQPIYADPALISALESRIGALEAAVQPDDGDRTQQYRQGQAVLGGLPWGSGQDTVSHQGSEFAKKGPNDPKDNLDARLQELQDQIDVLTLLASNGSKDMNQTNAGATSQQKGDDGNSGADSALPPPGSIGTVLTSNGFLVDPSYQPLAVAGGRVYSTAVNFTASGSFTVPAGVNDIFIYIIAGGGGGGGGDGTSFGAGNINRGGSGGGGGGGAFGSVAVAPGQMLTITIGAAGASSAVGGAGGVGGSTSVVGSSPTLSVTVTGGGGGSAGGVFGVGGGGGGNGSATSTGVVFVAGLSGTIGAVSGFSNVAGNLTAISISAGSGGLPGILDALSLGHAGGIGGNGGSSTSGGSAGNAGVALIYY